MRLEFARVYTMHTFVLKKNLAKVMQTKVNDSKQVWRKHSSSVVILSVQQFVASRVNV